MINFLGHLVGFLNSLGLEVIALLKNVTQFSNQIHYGALKMKCVHPTLIISPWLKLCHYVLIMVH
jgi:hypothetical protein